MSTSNILFFVPMFVAGTAVAQTTLAPVWVHTWPYGNGATLTIIPSSVDNHVAVDPATGNVFVSIDDQQQLVSMHWDLLYSFLSDGSEVTPVPTPLLGSWNDTSFPTINQENTEEFAVHDGDILQAHGHGSTSLNGYHKSFSMLRSTGARWGVDFGTLASVPPSSNVWIDTDGALLGGTGDGGHAWIASASAGGWLQWAEVIDAMGPIRDLLVLNNVIYATAGGTLRVLDRSTGQTLDQFALTSGMLATDGTDLYFAYSDLSAIHWGKRTTGGGVIWDQQHSGSYQVNELKIDGNGRAWIAANIGYPDYQGRLLVTTSDGSAYQEFGYGASINDLDLDDSQAYLTGWSDTTTTETYLMAIGQDFSVGSPEVTAQELLIVPQPADDEIVITAREPIASLTLLDARGRAIRTAAGNVRSIDVSDLSPGYYHLRVEMATRCLVRPIVIAR